MGVNAMGVGGLGIYLSTEDLEKLYSSKGSSSQESNNDDETDEFYEPEDYEDDDNDSEDVDYCESFYDYFPEEMDLLEIEAYGNHFSGNYEYILTIQNLDFYNLEEVGLKIQHLKNFMSIHSLQGEIQIISEGLLG